MTYRDWIHAKRLRALSQGLIGAGAGFAQTFMAGKEKQYEAQEAERQATEQFQRQSKALTERAKLEDTLIRQRATEAFGREVEVAGAKAGVPLMTAGTPAETISIPEPEPTVVAGKPMPFGLIQKREIGQVPAGLPRRKTTEEIMEGIALRAREPKPEKKTKYQEEYQQLVDIYGEEEAKTRYASKYTTKTPPEERRAKNAVDIWSKYTPEQKEEIRSQLEKFRPLDAGKVTKELIDQWAKDMTPIQFYEQLKLTKLGDDSIAKTMRFTDREKADLEPYSKALDTAIATWNRVFTQGTINARDEIMIKPLSDVTLQGYANAMYNQALEGNQENVSDLLNKGTAYLINQKDPQLAKKFVSVGYDPEKLTPAESELLGKILLGLDRDKDNTDRQQFYTLKSLSDTIVQSIKLKDKKITGYIADRKRK